MVSITTLSGFIQNVSNFNISQHKMNFVLNFCLKSGEPVLSCIILWVMLDLCWFCRDSKFPIYCVYSIFMFLLRTASAALCRFFDARYESRPQAVLQPEPATLGSEVPCHMPVCGWTSLTQLIFQHACACECVHVHIHGSAAVPPLREIKFHKMWWMPMSAEPAVSEGVRLSAHFAVAAGA